MTKNSPLTYPTRCVIIDVIGHPFYATPDVSKPHIEKHGLAEKEIDEDGYERVKITLDDGNIIYGYECWWVTEKDWEIGEKLKKELLKNA